MIILNIIIYHKFFVYFTKCFIIAHWMRHSVFEFSNLRSKIENLIIIWAKVHFKYEHTARQGISAYFFISGRCRCLHFEPLSADSDIVLTISCMPNQNFIKQTKKLLALININPWNIKVILCDNCHILCNYNSVFKTVAMPSCFTGPHMKGFRAFYRHKPSLNQS